MINQNINVNFVNIWQLMLELAPYNEVWPTPQSFGVGLFTDFRLYWEALSVAITKPSFSIDDIIEELPYRVRGLMFVEGFKLRTYQDLIRELVQYHYIEKYNGASRYEITEEGKAFLLLYKESPRKAQQHLLEKMQSVFITPAWLINRLWELNPYGQGQICIPAPLKDWKTLPRPWNDYLWTCELEDISSFTYDKINNILPNSFPINKTTWLSTLKIEYERAGTLRPRRSVSYEEIKKVNYNPRARLSMAMKNVAVKLLFSRLNPKTNKWDFANSRAQLTHRAFTVWCPRLEEFGLLMYTDYKPEIPGRLVFPTSVFKPYGKYPNYEHVRSLQTPSGKELYIFTPSWSEIRHTFLKVLCETYDYFYNMQRIIYISSQDIRDEVCRQIRINPKLFDIFLKNTYIESLKGLLQMSISLETDLRQDMKVQINRRGVYIDNNLYTLIAIKSL